VQHYLDTYSKRTFKILIGLESPLDEYLFNALLTKLNTVHNAENLQPVLVLLSNIVQTSPSWLPKFINSKSLKQFFAILKNEQDVVILGYAVLILVELVATLPSVISDCLIEIFECFSRLTAFLYLSKFDCFLNFLILSNSLFGIQASRQPRKSATLRMFSSFK